MNMIILTVLDDLYQHNFCYIYIKLLRLQLFEFNTCHDFDKHY